MNINTCLFDLDGTLINTNELIVASFLHTLRDYAGLPYERADVLKFIGPPLEDSFRSVDPARVEEFVSVYRAFNIEQHDHLVTDYPTVLETVKQLKEEGYKLGVVTTKVRHTVLLGLKKSQLEPLFDVVVTLDDVTHPKPHREPIDRAMKELGATPEQTVMVGDNVQDIQAGKNAGTFTAGVVWTVQGKEVLEKERPDVMLEHMSDLISWLKGKA
ncbi:MAG: pyrophosphatase PpaX [Bacilli bacterium]